MDKTDKIGQVERGSPGEEGEGELQCEHAEPGVCVSVVSSSDSGSFLGAYRHLVQLAHVCGKMGLNQAMVTDKGCKVTSYTQKYPLRVAFLSVLF